MSEQLTIDEFEALEKLEDAPAWMGVDGGGVFGDLADGGYVGNAANKWYLRATGRKALAAYKAHRDLVLFVAEFEEKLENMGKNIDGWGSDENTIEEWDRGYKSAYKRVSAIYRECKERVSNVE